MRDTRGRINAAYLEAKRAQLLKLRAELQHLANEGEAEESRIRAAAPYEAREYEDDAEELDFWERERRLVNRSIERLKLVERALAKIDNGTYGFSDLSGERIPDERLELIPDAIITLREEQIAEREAQ